MPPMDTAGASVRTRLSLAALASARLAWCVVCCRFGPMIYRRRIIPRRLVELWGISPRLARAFARKESCSSCTHCGLPRYGRDESPRSCNSPLWHPIEASPALSSGQQWVEQPATAEAPEWLKSTSSMGCIHCLRSLPLFSGSDYKGEEIQAAARDATERSEDLTRLTYPDNSFDVVLTSETLEHVPDLHAALREIHRVLSPGGRHVFTVPVLPTTQQTFPRSIVLLDGTIEDRALRICHPGGDSGYPVFTEFGTDLPKLLEEQGFRNRGLLRAGKRG